MKSLSSWSPVLVLLLVTCGCSAATDESSDDGDETPKLNTTIEIIKADVPARYAAALPTTEAGSKRWIQGDEKLPPVVHVIDTLMGGDAKSFEKLAAAAKAVPADEAESWARLLDSALQLAFPNDRACALARPIVRAPASTLRRALIGTYAGMCASDEDLPLIVRGDTPDSAVLRYYGSDYSGDTEHPYHARLGTAARKEILESEHAGRRTAFILAQHPDAQAQAALRKIHSEIRDPKRADQIALAFYESTDPKDKAMATAACQRNPGDPVCDHHLRTADGSVFEVGEAPEAPKPSAASVKAMIDKLAGAGFTKVTVVDPAKAETDAADQLLLIAGHAWWFDVETGFYPNNHDSLMRQLAALVSPELDDAIFEEVGPGLDDEGSKPYVLTVYVAGKRLRAEARNLGDWYDVEAVLNLMNTVARERGSKSRFVGLASQDQTMIVVGASEEAIARAVQGGLIEVAVGSEAMEVGKAFE